MNADTSGVTASNSGLSDTRPNQLAKAPWYISDLRISTVPTNKPLVGPVSFEVRPGAFHVVIGESGSGKTLALRGIAGLPPRGVQTAHSGKSLPRSVMIFQDPAGFLNPRWRVERSLSDVLWHVRGLERRRSEEELTALSAAVGLDRGDLRRYPFQLSGGMVQRVAIAMALATDARLILADEITSALDPERVDAILDLITDQLCSRGIAVLWSTHDLERVVARADHVYVLERGHVVEQQPGPEILSHPNHPYTRKLVASRSALGYGTEGP